MDTLERKEMPAVTLRHIRGDELPPSLQNKFNVKSYQSLTITIEIEDEQKRTDDSEFEIENLGDSLIESLQEITEAKRQGKRLPNARDLLNEL